MFISGSIAQLKDKDYYIGLMDSGVKLMEAGNYREADEKFKIVLRNVEVLPSEISFYFGQNSYLLGEYKQSINWLNKYIELKGTKGQFFEECVEYLEKSEKAYLLQSEIEKRNILTELSQHNEFDCKGRQFFRCPICKAEGVLIEPGKMNNVIYKTCPYCVGEGRITCDDYKLFLKGNLKPKQ
jgi:tetratricopeptide (TPR) repeat protein